MSSKVRRDVVRRLFAMALSAAAFGVLTITPHHAAAQEVEPNEYVPLPAGTNLIIGYYVYEHDTAYSVANGPTYKHNTGIEVNIGIARFVHYTSLFGMPAGVQVLEFFGSESGATLAGQSLGSAFGAQNTVLSAFLWPISNAKTGTNFNLTGFIAPPNGSYNRNNSINIGDNRLRGDAETGLDQAFGPHASLTLSFDTMFYGTNANATAYGLHLNSTPTYRAQAFANWRWNKVFQSSIGYDGEFGGIESVNGTRDGNRTEEQEIRAVSSMFLSPRSQVLLEVNHDLEEVGGYRKLFGITGRFLYVF